MPDALINGIRLHYEVYGDGDPIVLAHGFGATLNMWSEQIEPLSQKYKVVVYDFRGHGRTEAPRDWRSYNVDAYVEDQRQLMDHLSIDKAYVGGLSMGGMIAMHFALAHPERLKALLLCDTAASNRRLGGEQPEGRAAQEIRSFIVRDLFPLGFAVGRYVPLEHFPQVRSAPPGVKAYVREMRQHTALGLRGAWHALMTRPDVEDRLREITVPVLIIVGDRDQLLGASHIMQERLPGCRFVLIKGSPHGTANWRSDAFNTAVLDFLADVEGGRDVAGEVTL